MIWALLGGNRFQLNVMFLMGKCILGCLDHVYGGDKYPNSP